MEGESWPDPGPQAQLLHSCSPAGLLPGPAAPQLLPCPAAPWPSCSPAQLLYSPAAPQLLPSPAAPRPSCSQPDCSPAAPQLLPGPAAPQPGCSPAAPQLQPRLAAPWPSCSPAAPWLCPPAPAPSPGCSPLCPRPELALCPQCTMLAPSSSLGPPRTEPMMTFCPSSPTSSDPVFPVSARALGWGREMGAGPMASGCRRTQGFSEKGCFSSALLPHLETWGPWKGCGGRWPSPSESRSHQQPPCTV